MPTDPAPTPTPAPAPAPEPTPPLPAPKPIAEPADVTPLTIAQRSTHAARALHAAGVIDLDAGLALLEETIKAETFDAAAAVKNLRSLKPVLFASRAATGTPRTGAASATMSAAAPSADPRDSLIRAAEQAAATGDRNAVLSYQRLKRQIAIAAT